MKDYALKINGHNYDVRIDDVNESSTLAHVVVNGTAYEVEIAGTKALDGHLPEAARRKIERLVERALKTK